MSHERGYWNRIFALVFTTCSYVSLALLVFTLGFVLFGSYSLLILETFTKKSTDPQTMIVLQRVVQTLQRDNNFISRSLLIITFSFTCLVNYGFWKTVAMLSLDLGRYDFYHIKIQVLIRRLRALLVTSLGSSILGALAFNNFVDVFLPLVHADLSSLPHSVDFYRGLVYQGFTYFLSLEFTPILKCILILLCSACLQAIRKSQELEGEVQDLRAEQSFVI